MINPSEISGFMEKALPELSGDLQKDDACKSAYATVHLLANYTGDQVNEHNYKAAKKCFALAEKLYNKGNSAVKNAIETVYIYSFSNILSKAKGEREQLMAIIPITLFSLYIRQVVNSHI